LVGCSWSLLLAEFARRELALGVEFVAQVVQRIAFAVPLRAESRAGGCGEVAEVGECTGQAVAESADLGGQNRDQVKSAGDLASGGGAEPQAGEPAVPCRRGGLVVSVGYLLRVNVRVVVRLGYGDHLL
jgi:hypothetical protein